MTSHARPKMPALKVGDQLIAIGIPGHPWLRESATVYQTGRKYAYAETGTRRIKFDAVTGVAQGSGFCQLYTLEQLSWEERRDEAFSFLEDAIGSMTSSGRGRYDDREIELANAIRRYEGLEEL